MLDKVARKDKEEGIREGEKDKTKYGVEGRVDGRE